ncbi:MAG: hypothetical protein ABS41_03060 [Arenimonas sp. SCN 70-307]|uniref:hypothetical protein n=1 Tax=Arenimonas sp. SCN 70-307 TaxID=1660089 RepID=UPI00086DB2A7|nr:hypothetical protein [Arenimonas sp. SCN 70-307]ODS64256.1 MAG: hypothetical protein ABS41_03060 [Arenimonas sp. SCN 70-307]
MSRLALVLLLASGGAAAAEPSAWCDALFPVGDIAAVIGAERAAGIERRASGVVAEDARHCSRLYSIGEDRFSDELVFMVSPARDAAGAVRTIESIARGDGGRRFGESRPEGLGAAAVHFRAPDPLASHRMEFNVSFALGDRVIELRYFNVDDGKQNKYLQASSELEAIARRIAERGLP